jgi:hypothetical protein
MFSIYLLCILYSSPYIISLSCLHFPYNPLFSWFIYLSMQLMVFFKLVHLDPHALSCQFCFVGWVRHQHFPAITMDMS